jgi:hypothetical protein
VGSFFAFVLVDAVGSPAPHMRDVSMKFWWGFLFLINRLLCLLARCSEKFATTPDSSARTATVEAMNFLYFRIESVRPEPWPL